MKKQLLIAAGAVIALASCQNDTGNQADTQAQIDSTVNARVEEMRIQMMMQNDSIINAMAMERADSIVAAMKTGSSAPATRPSTNKKTTSTPSTKPENTKTSDEKSRNNQNTSAADQKSRNNDAGRTVEDQKRRNNQ